MSNTTRYHVGHNVPGHDPVWPAQCIADAIDAADWQAYDAESVATYYKGRHDEECSAVLDQDRPCGHDHYLAFLQAQELTERCERGEIVSSFMIDGEEWWIRRVDDCGCPCNCDDPCNGEHIHTAVNKITG
ncbi:hypothetical protein [Streptomyces natalensis]|uniref:Uncharacterized protein n=1 Tax=Streptomyces natalensis ATCC 27448 TaxID=1240678 RepID=A0A0D7CE30_9ACTN|nr:hypothetical protein [Streptomyces natalensis]KIZ14494.1 hypothetical protein SNA_36085 [Streptomyces natalensis ATCC 27448]